MSPVVEFIYEEFTGVQLYLVHSKCKHLCKDTPSRQNEMRATV